MKKISGTIQKQDQPIGSESSDLMGKRFGLLSYGLCGMLHEVAHVIAANSLGYATNDAKSLFGFLFGRAAVISSMRFASEYELNIVRHAGWISSLVLAVVACVVHRYLDKKCTEILFFTAVLTLVEAIVTDGLGFGIADTMASRSAFFCGNFGIIMLNDAWVKCPGDNGTTVLNLLEKMISITMMRGGV